MDNWRMVLANLKEVVREETGRNRIIQEKWRGKVKKSW